jgi:O-antigen ligase
VFALPVTGALAVTGNAYRSGVALSFVAVLALAGGASRYDEDQQMIVRLAGLLVIAASLWPLDFEPIRKHRTMLAFFLLSAGLLVLQLLPLPPGLWAALPGHEPYATIAEVSRSVVWRPLSLEPDRTVNALEALLVPAAAALAAWFLDRRGRIRLLQALVAVACLSALLGLAQLGAGGDALHLYRQTTENAPVGLLANRNHQAALLACALPCTAALAAMRLGEGADHRPVLLVTLAVISLLLAMLVTTGSRMGLVLGLAGMAGAGLCWRSMGRPLLPRSPRDRLTLLGTAAALLAGVAVLAVRSGALLRLAASDFADDKRAQILAPLLATAKAFMPFGAGFGAFEAAYRRFEPDALLSTIYMNAAHNDVLQLAIEGGVPALGLLVAFCFWWARTAIRIVRSATSRTRRTTGVAAIVVTLLLMLASLVDYPLRTPLLAALFTFACVEMARVARAASSAPEDSRDSRPECPASSDA